MQNSGIEANCNKWQAAHAWLLVQVTTQDGIDQTSVNGSTKYFILLPIDLLESDTSKTHAEGFVRFLHNQHLMEGRVIFSALDRRIVEEKLHKLTAPPPRQIQTKPNRPLYFLIQFSKGSKDIVQAVVPENDVSWPSGIQADQREVMICDGSQKRIATVLYSSESKEDVLMEFQKLKIFCFEKGFDEHEYDNVISENTWMLVLYTCGPTNVVYTLLNNRDTFWQRGNRYKDAVAYITDGRNVYQAIIIRNSHSYEELLHYLNFIKSSAVVADYPLNVDVTRADALPPPTFQSLCGSIETFERFAGNRQYATLEHNLNELEDRMRDEAAALIECMEVLGHAKQTLEQREAIFRDSVNLPQH